MPAVDQRKQPHRYLEARLGKPAIRAHERHAFGFPQRRRRFVEGRLARLLDVREPELPAARNEKARTKRRAPSVRRGRETEQARMRLEKRACLGHQRMGIGDAVSVRNQHDLGFLARRERGPIFREERREASRPEPGLPVKRQGDEERDLGMRFTERERQLRPGRDACAAEKLPEHARERRGQAPARGFARAGRAEQQGRQERQRTALHGEEHRIPDDVFPGQREGCRPESQREPGEVVKPQGLRVMKPRLAPLKLARQEHRHRDRERGERVLEGLGHAPEIRKNREREEEPPPERRARAPQAEERGNRGADHDDEREIDRDRLAHRSASRSAPSAGGSS